MFQRLNFIFSIVSMTLALAALTLVGIQFHQGKIPQISEACNIERLCVTKTFIIKEIQDTLFNSMFDEGEYLCVNTVKKLSELLEQVLSKYLSRQENSKVQLNLHDRLTPVSALKYFKTPSHHLININTQEKSLGQHITLELDPEYLKPAVEHIRGAEVKQQGLGILYTGIYYVYNSVTFTSNTTQPRQNLFSYVHRVSPNRPSYSGVLLRSALSCENCLGISETSYTGGVFYLQEGDIIQVCISQQATFVLDNESTYVGLFLLKSF